MDRASSVCGRRFIWFFCVWWNKNCSPCPFQSVTPPAGSVLGHLQTTVRPVPPRPACTRAAVSPAAHKASLSRTTSAKVRAHSLTHSFISILVSTPELSERRRRNENWTKCPRFPKMSSFSRSGAAPQKKSVAVQCRNS